MAMKAWLSYSHRGYEPTSILIRHSSSRRSSQRDSFHCKAFSTAWIGPRSRRLYDFGEFPGAVLDPSSRTMIHGELVVLPSNGRILEALDRYEEFDPLDLKKSLFVRKKAKVRMANGSSREGWIYVYNRHPGKATRVRGGDYLRFKFA